MILSFQFLAALFYIKSKREETLPSKSLWKSGGRFLARYTNVKQLKTKVSLYKKMSIWFSTFSGKLQVWFDILSLHWKSAKDKRRRSQPGQRGRSTWRGFPFTPSITVSGHPQSQLHSGHPFPFYTNHSQASGWLSLRSFLSSLGVYDSPSVNFWGSSSSEVSPTSPIIVCPRCPERGWHVLIGPGDGGSKPEDEADLAFLPLPPPCHDRRRGRLSLEERCQPGVSQFYQVWCWQALILRRRTTQAKLWRKRRFWWEAPKAWKFSGKKSQRRWVGKYPFSAKVVMLEILL